MTGFVIQNAESKKYVAPLNYEKAYVDHLEQARIFATAEAAESERCPGNEVVVPIHQILKVTR